MSMCKIDDKSDLSRSEFADAIAKGLGRAFLYIKNHGLDRVHDLLLNACLHDLSYDTQYSESRSKWLFFMLVNSPHYLEFRDEILAVLFMESDRSKYSIDMPKQKNQSLPIIDNLEEARAIEA
jgi:hypothetical protein